VFKAFYSTDDLIVKYLDDEDEEIGISSQSDLDYAYQIASNSNDNLLNLKLVKSNGEVIAKPFLKIKSLKRNVPENKTIQQTESVVLDAPPNFSESQQKWLRGYLENFREEITQEFEKKMKDFLLKKDKIAQYGTGAASSQINEDLIELDINPSNSFEIKVKKLIDMLIQSRVLGRALKSAYLEEELYSIGAFCATFVKDHNMPDGSKCEPNMKFVKTWLIQNTGKLEWSPESFPVKLICIAGNISSENQFVDVAKTKINETSSISVELVAPSDPGNYFSEWVLSCNNFQFGPRIWCTIEVIENPLNSIQSSIATTEIDPSCVYAKANSTDLKSLNSLNVSMIETFITTSTESSKNRYLTEDFDDDEFVVVPDCFDLTKKWKPSALDAELNQLKKSLLESQFNASFIDFDNESEISADINKKLDQLTENVKKLSNNDLIMLDSCSGESNVSSNKNENNQTVDLTVDISVSPVLSQSQPDHLDSYQETIVENAKASTSASSDIMSNKRPQNTALIRLVPDTVNTNNNKDTESTENHLSTFDLMKNAFSNMQGPSYVTAFDLNSNSDSSVGHLSNKSSTQSPMDKLITMGFANRQLNTRLLEKYNNDLEKVVQSICDHNDNNDWYLNR
jgi:hypothetical protein